MRSFRVRVGWGIEDEDRAASRRINGLEAVEAEDVANDRRGELYSRWSMYDEISVAQHCHLIGEGGHKGEIVQNHHHGDAEVAHQSQDVGAGARVEVVGWLVQQQQAGLLGKRPGKRPTLPFPGGQCAERPTGECHQAHAGERLDHDRAVARCGVAAAVRQAFERHVIAQWQAKVGRVGLSHYGDAARTIRAGEPRRPIH